MLDPNVLGGDPGRVPTSLSIGCKPQVFHGVLLLSPAQGLGLQIAATAQQANVAYSESSHVPL